MEAVAALSLACNVVQVAQTSFDLIKLLKEVCKKGSSANHNYQHTHSIHLKTAVDTLKSTLSSCQPGSGRSLDPNDVELLDIAQKSAELANQLRNKIGSVPQSSRRRDVLKVFSKTLMTRNSIDEIGQRLTVLQRDLNTRILVNLSLKVDAIKIDTQNTADLSPELKQFVHNLALKQSQALQDIIMREQMQTRHIIESNTATFVKGLGANREEADKQRNRDLRREQYDRLLNSLTYPEMNARLHQITMPHTDTFGWIFNGELDADKTDVGVSDISLEEDQKRAGRATINEAPILWHEDERKIRWDNLIDWLSNSNGAYWVNGKVGSGKSTLMKFLANDIRTRAALEKWTGQRPLAIVQHYFWSSGTALQRSSKAFFLSVLRQILEQHSLIIHEDVLRSPAWAHKRIPDDWSQSELIHFIEAIEQHADLNICMFVDGLDENEVPTLISDQNVIEYLMTVSNRPNVKFCVASRPLKVYQQQFKDFPGLRLQDLTYHDMKKFILDNLHKFDRLRTCSLTPIELKILQDEIVRRADGVFMWVSLALKSLEQGFLNDDSPETLNRRLKQLPPRLQELYEHMWRQLNGDEDLYKEEAAFLFCLLLHRDKFWPLLTQTRTLLCFTLAADDDYRQDLLMSFPDHDESKLNSKCKAMMNRIQTRCAGIIEITTNGLTDGKDVYDVTQFKPTCLAYQVQFVHRSAYAFLRETRFGTSILDCCSFSETDLAIKMVEVLLPGMVKAILPNYIDRSHSLAKSRHKLLWSAIYQLFPDNGVAMTSDDRSKLYRSIFISLRRCKDSSGPLRDPCDPIYSMYLQMDPWERDWLLDLDGFLCLLKSRTVLLDSFFRSDKCVNPEFADYMLLCNMNWRPGFTRRIPSRWKESLGASRLVFDATPNFNRIYFLRYIFPFKKSATLMLLDSLLKYLGPLPLDGVIHPDVCPWIEYWQVYMKEAMRSGLDLSAKFVVMWHPNGARQLFIPVEDIFNSRWRRYAPLALFEVNLCFLVQLVYILCTQNLLLDDKGLALAGFVERSEILPQCHPILMVDGLGISHSAKPTSDDQWMTLISQAPWKVPSPEVAVRLVNDYKTLHVPACLPETSADLGKDQGSSFLCTLDSDFDLVSEPSVYDRDTGKFSRDQWRQLLDHGQPAQFFDVLEAKGYFKRFDDPEVMHIAPKRWLEDDG